MEKSWSLKFQMIKLLTLLQILNGTMTVYQFLVSYEGEQLKRIPMEPGFWFEWVAFHPDTSSLW